MRQYNKITSLVFTLCCLFAAASVHAQGMHDAHYVDQTSTTVTGLAYGPDGYAWYWSASDQAFWAVRAADATLPQIAHFNTYWPNSSCTGSPVIVPPADNRVVYLPGFGFARAGAAASPTSCWQMEGPWACMQSICPGDVVTAVAAVSPPNLSAYTAPFKLVR